MKAQRHRQEIGERKHRALRLPGGPGCVADDRQVAAASVGDVLLEEAWSLLQQLPAALLDLRKRKQPLVAIAPQPARVRIDDVRDLRELLDHPENLVDLLLVLGDDEA